MRSLLFVLFSLVSVPNIAAADFIEKFAPIFVDTDDTSVFFLFGDIDSRTALNFDRAVEEYGIPDLLVLASDGGLVDQGLIVARNVRRHGINTLIPDESGCYSACALIFLAGTVRVADGELGVHQISSNNGDLQSGQVAISDILDVLGDFSVPNELLVDMFRTPPEKMHILTDDEKIAYGFLLRTSQERADDLGKPLESQALDLLLHYNASWSKPNPIALVEVMALYDGTVQFYGKTYTTAQLHDEKLAFAERWPVRQYSVDGDSVSVSCRDMICLVKGNVTWFAQSVARGKTSRGVAYFELTIRFDPDRPRIIAENGKVISRD